MSRYAIIGWLALIISVAACIPAATVPPQLSATAAPPVTVTDDHYQSAIFSVMRPDGWRVITSPADVPVNVIFVAPDDRALIVVSSAALGENPPTPTLSDDDTLQTDTQTHTVNGQPLTVYLAGASSDWDGLTPILSRLVDSLAVPN